MRDDGEHKCSGCGERLWFWRQTGFQVGVSAGKGLSFHGSFGIGIEEGLELELWFCPECGKVEFYIPQRERESFAEGSEYTRICPVCKVRCDAKAEKCSYCGAKNPAF